MAEDGAGPRVYVYAMTVQACASLILMDLYSRIERLAGLGVCVLRPENILDRDLETRIWSPNRKRRFARSAV